MRTCLFALPALVASSLVLGACSGVGTPSPTTLPATRSIWPAQLLRASAVKNIGGSYQGEGYDSVLGASVYALGLTQTKSSLVGFLAVQSKTGKLQTKLKGSVTKTGYTLKGNAPCTGTISGQVTSDGDGLTGVYKLTCSGIVHKGHYLLEKV